MYGMSRAKQRGSVAVITAVSLVSMLGCIRQRNPSEVGI
jgi:hypothetical protein